jgi:hypothetical protein
MVLEATTNIHLQRRQKYLLRLIPGHRRSLIITLVLAHEGRFSRALLRRSGDVASCVSWLATTPREVLVAVRLHYESLPLVG